jgi:hypothetical protein
LVWFVVWVVAVVAVVGRSGGPRSHSVPDPRGYEMQRRDPSTGTGTERVDAVVGPLAASFAAPSRLEQPQESPRKSAATGQVRTGQEKSVVVR